MYELKSSVDDELKIIRISIMKKLILCILSFAASINASQLTVTNNYTSATGTVTINYTDNSTGTLSSLSAYKSFTTASNKTVKNIVVDGLYGPSNASNFTILPPSTASVGLYTPALLTNSASSSNSSNFSNPLTVNYYNSSNALMGSVSLNTNQSLPILNGAASLSIKNSSGSTLLSTTNFTNTTTYQITNTNGTWSLTSYAPTLTNNSIMGQDATQLYFYGGDYGVINSSALTLDANSSINSNSQATYFKCTAYNGTTLTVATTFPTQNLFSANYLQNNSSQSISINYYGVINGVSNTNLNSNQISISSAGQNQIITGSATFKAYDSSGNKITFSDGSTSLTINANTNYYINY